MIFNDKKGITHIIERARLSGEICIDLNLELFEGDDKQ